MAGRSSVDMELTDTADLVGQGTAAMVDTVVTECLSWEDMAVTGHLMAVTVAGHIRLCHPRLQRREFLKDCSAGTVVHLSTGREISVVDAARLFSDSASEDNLVYDLIQMKC